MAFKLKNFTVQAFNRDVNQSGDLLRKYAAWSGYRARVAALIGDALAQHPAIDRALVLAAGNLNDIVLHFLCGNLRSLTLSDADTDAVERGIDRQSLSEGERAKIQIVQADYTGAAQAGFFDALEKRVRQQATAQELAHHIQAALAVLAAAPIQKVEQPYPLVVSCPVYTQLLYTQIEVFLKLLYEAQRYSYDDLNLILNAAYGEIPGILTRYNTMLCNACAPDGRIVLLSDMVEMDIGGKAYCQAQQAAANGQINAQDAVALIAEYGSELAQIGREDFRKRTQTIQEQYLLWPFDESKAYLVSACLAELL
ncbi:MAG TPA: hypothetical protein PKU80_03530 [Candidatus Limiplasma sp.]|mgnify:CR=1 FL=1|nr:hypothetical protein [Candidatus Limiplasma sp.]HRX09175.1 hypothetical protein [Candidatus Limiplasma sp.]